MGHIKEPAGVDLNIEPMPLTVEDLQLVSSLIAEYKLTKQVPISKPKSVKRAIREKATAISNQQKKTNTPKTTASLK